MREVLNATNQPILPSGVVTVLSVYPGSWKPAPGLIGYLKNFITSWPGNDILNPFHRQPVAHTKEELKPIPPQDLDLRLYREACLDAVPIPNDGYPW